MTRLKLSLLAAICLLLLAFSWDGAPKWFYEYQIQRMQAVIQEQNHRLLVTEAQNATMTTELIAARSELDAAREIVEMAQSVEQMRFDLSRLKANRKKASKDLSVTRAELSRVRNATMNINTAAGFVSTIRSTCCGSMAPYITDKDLVFILWSPTSVKVGDVVGSFNPACQRLHRITRVVEGGYKTKGDALQSEDPCVVTLSDIHYKVVAVARRVYW